MKQELWTPFRFLALLYLMAWATGPRASAQTPVVLSLQTYAGLTITGSVGTVYTVQYATNLAQPDWRGAGMVQLPSSPYLWVDTGAPATELRFYRTVDGPTNMVWIPPGTFTMGSPSNEVERSRDEGPQTVVTLTRGFFMGKYEVTQGEYIDQMGNNPSHFTNGADYPVEQVTWIEATNYCTRLTERERGAGWLPVGWVYRLPTEAEWEYACRAGTTSAFHYGPALHSGMANFNARAEYDSSLGSMSNDSGVSLGRTTRVGSYEANGWGLCDMHGNVCEWCANWWSSSLPGGRVVDPQGPSSDSNRGIRGGSWSLVGRACRSAYRSNGYSPGNRSYFLGFRVVLAPTQ